MANGKSSTQKAQKKTERKTAQVTVDTQAIIDPPTPKQTFIAKDINPDQYVTVRNGFQGRLVYISRHTGEKFIWDSFGAEQDMELSELKRARSSSKKFFINNWFMFDEQWIVDYLGMAQYYKHAIKIEDFDRLFEMPVEELASVISKMSDGQKRSVAYRARQLIADGAIDSNKMITTLESCLGTELIDRL